MKYWKLGPNTSILIFPVSKKSQNTHECEHQDSFKFKYYNVLRT